MNGGTFKEIADSAGTDFLSAVGVPVRGEITQEELAEQWLDAKVVIKMGRAAKAQHRRWHHLREHGGRVATIAVAKGRLMVENK